MIIKSSKILRNDCNVISELAHKEVQPIFITKNGEGDLVIMSIETYERREEILRLRAKLDADEQERLSGCKTYTLDEAKKELKDIING